MPEDQTSSCPQAVSCGAVNEVGMVVQSMQEKECVPGAGAATMADGNWQMAVGSGNGNGSQPAHPIDRVKFASGHHARRSDIALPAGSRQAVASSANNRQSNRQVILWSCMVSRHIRSGGQFASGHRARRSDIVLPAGSREDGTISWWQSVTTSSRFHGPGS